MISEIVFNDITFGVFPKLDTDLRFAFATIIWDNSVGDLLYMLLDALSVSIPLISSLTAILSCYAFVQGVRYLHETRIAHQDLFLQNFMVEWQPESLHKQTSRRPRVFIIDFEDAVMFPEGTKTEDMVVPKFPRVLEECGRPIPPEARLSKPYCPFRADMWQFGEILVHFKVSTYPLTFTVALPIHVH